MHFSLKICHLTSGANKFKDLPENQMTKFYAEFLRSMQNLVMEHWQWGVAPTGRVLGGYFSGFRIWGVNQTLGGALPSPFVPCFSLPSLSLCTPLSPPILYLSPPIEVGPSNPARGSGECCKLCQWGLGQSPSQNWIRCILALKSDICLQQI